MNISVKKDGEIYIIKVDGNIKYDNINEFTSSINKLIEENKKGKFVFDLADMAYINSATIGKFVDIFKKITDYGGIVRFCNVRPFVKNILDITSLSQIFDIEKDLESAKQALLKIKLK
jgi:anti-anti-sigma factor